MREDRALGLAALLLLLALLKLLFPAETRALRAWAGEAVFPGAAETVETWGRTLAGEERQVSALWPETGP